MSKTITKKSVTERFNQIWHGVLTFDIRLNHLDANDVRRTICTTCGGSGTLPGNDEEHEGIPYNCPDCVDGITPGKNSDLENYEVGDTLIEREWILNDYCESGRMGKDYYSGSAVSCKIKCMSVISVPQVKCDSGPIYPLLDFEGKTYWSAEDLHKYGIVILGIEVTERISRKR